MRILLTGHQGYLGTIIAADLVAAGHDVVGLDTGYFADCTLGPVPAEVAALPAHAADLRDVTAAHVEGVQAVVHMAALSNDPLGALAPETTHAVNHHASVRLARLARAAGVSRFVYASTCSVYGASGTDALLGEDAPLAPITPYAVSKVRVEEDLHALADDSFSPTYLRNATAFGVSPRLRADIVLNNLVGSAVLTGTIKVLSDGTPWRPLAHAQDISSGVLATLAAPREAVHDQAFNIGTPENNVRVHEIAETVAQALPGTSVRITGEAGGDPRSYRVDFSKAVESLPGFEPRWTVADGARELAEAYQRHGLTQEVFGQRFTRLARLQDLAAAGRIGADLRWTAR